VKATGDGSPSLMAAQIVGCSGQWAKIRAKGSKCFQR
jgi:hypothetical protein